VSAVNARFPRKTLDLFINFREHLRAAAVARAVIASLAKQSSFPYWLDCRVACGMAARPC